MNIKEIKELLDRIKSHYNTFTINENKIKEWYKFLKDYESEDVNKKLDEYLTYEHENPPLVTSLTRTLNKKETPANYWITSCDICGQKITICNNDMTEYEEHHRKCSKIDFIDRMSMKYKNKHIASIVYYEMSDEELEKAYRKIMDFYIKNKEDSKAYKEMPSLE